MGVVFINRLRYRIPDLQKSLNMIDFLKKKKVKRNHFLLIR